MKQHRSKQSSYLTGTLLLSLLCLLSFSGCSSFSSRDLAPKEIGASQIIFSYKQADPDFRSLADKKLTFNFYTDLTYESFLDKKPYSAGDYAYNRTGDRSAKLTVSYTYEDNIEDQIFHLFFDTNEKGKFEVIPYGGKLKNETGTFVINYNAAEPSSS